MKWEYKLVMLALVDIKDLVPTFNSLGKDGWELTTFSTDVRWGQYPRDPDHTDHFAIMKRPVPNSN
jgi:hypothetical protein